MKIFLSIAIIALAFTSCKKEGTGGKATITGHVKHHDDHIPNGVVYIKYGATSEPGTNAADYDDETLASAGDGHYEFEGLQKGDYYLFGTGFDSTIALPVSGGIAVKIKKKTETVDADVPVIED